MNGWKTILSFWGPAYFQGRSVSFRETNGSFYVFFLSNISQLGIFTVIVTCTMEVGIPFYPESPVNQTTNTLWDDPCKVFLMGQNLVDLDFLGLGNDLMTSETEIAIPEKRAASVVATQSSQPWLIQKDESTTLSRLHFPFCAMFFLAAIWYLCIPPHLPNPRLKKKPIVIARLAKGLMKTNPC